MADRSVMVRRATRDDLDEIVRFREAFDFDVDPGSTRAFLDDERHHLFLAYVDGTPAGFVSAVEVFHPDKRPELFLNEIAVIPEHRRRGAARALIDALKTLGRSLGCQAIWVLTDEPNAAAMALYANTGGEWDGSHTVMFEYRLDEEEDSPDRGVRRLG